MSEDVSEEGNQRPGLNQIDRSLCAYARNVRLEVQDGERNVLLEWWSSIHSGCVSVGGFGKSRNTMKAVCRFEMDKIGNDDFYNQVIKKTGLPQKHRIVSMNDAQSLPQLETIKKEQKERIAAKEECS